MKRRMKHYEYLKNRENIFSHQKLTNIITGSEISEEKTKFLPDVENYGEKLYNEYKTRRLVDKTKGIFDTISKPTIGKKKVSAEKQINPDKEHLKLVRTVDIARARGFDLQKKSYCNTK